MRKAFKKIIEELGEKDKDVVLLVGDFGYGIIESFRQKFPNRFFNLGICEQTMIGIAAGMALKGLKPYVYTITPFLLERPFEQVKLDVDQQNLNVKLIGYADYPGQGPTHEELDWKIISKVFKNISCYFPRNSEETRSALIESYENRKPTFISLKLDK
jgi:transketolase